MPEPSNMALVAKCYKHGGRPLEAVDFVIYWVPLRVISAANKSCRDNREKDTSLIV